MIASFQIKQIVNRPGEGIEARILVDGSLMGIETGPLRELLDSTERHVVDVLLAIAIRAHRDSGRPLADLRNATVKVAIDYPV